MESKAISHPCLPALQHASLEATTISHILCVLLEKFSAFPSIYLTWWHLRVTNFRYCTLIQKRNLWHKSRVEKVSTTAYVRKTQVLVDSYFNMNQLWSDCQKTLGKPGRCLVSEATNCKQQQMSSITYVHLLASVLGVGDTAVTGSATVQALTEVVFWGTREATESPHSALNCPDPVEVLCTVLGSSLH